MRVLVVEDERRLAELVARGLREAGRCAGRARRSVTARAAAGRGMPARHTAEVRHTGDDELLALHRHSHESAVAVLQAGDLRLDPGARRVFRDGAEIELSAREFDILALLII
ncbi:transcriptional regulatory protein resD [Actinoplanes sp. SE50]|uniref:response regulator transcription factor n=1 Tax=unclassified Actinoplanes TaxID=2626549 RepID=UPI00023EC9B5|nr:MULTISPECIES: response regulator transcription factor [unclassified Actinoplanes]AEV85399.1 Transcriptional regulatory protein resD [Actinoplanes sp. SE50/110]ATO83794.1 transcriptional regulatory protein resD [Actinoplanes sp. SE50]SLM01202.1 two-component system response regulator receiver [Actinoplanes sp. SE50/110]